MNPHDTTTTTNNNNNNHHDVHHNKSKINRRHHGNKTTTTITTHHPSSTITTLPFLKQASCQENPETNQEPNSQSPPPPPPPHHQLTTITTNERVLTSLAAGALAGAIAKTVIAPLDRTKIYFQTSPTSTFTARSVLNHLISSYKSKGLSSLWRGNSATMARIIPYAAIQFTAHEQWKSLFGVVDNHHHHHHHQSSSSGGGGGDNNNNKPSMSSELIRFMCGSLAGITAQSLTYPLDLTRARLAISPHSKYTGLTDVFSKTIRAEGLAGLYKGYVPTMLGVIPYAGCSFYCYELLKRVWVKWGLGEVGTVERLCFGALAGVVGQSCSYPFDIVRRRLQTNVIVVAAAASSSSSYRGTNVFRMMGDIARTEGIIGGLYKGLSMNWVKGPVAAGISFACYDFFAMKLRAEIWRRKRKTL